MARVAALPGVEAVSLAHIVAFSDLFWISGAQHRRLSNRSRASGCGFDFNVDQSELFPRRSGPGW